MRTLTLIAGILFLAICLQAHTKVKKGPPDLSGKWVIKNGDGSIKRHYTATQTGNYVTLKCTDAGEEDRTLNFNWDVPGNYVLSGNVTGIKFDDNYRRKIKDFYGGQTQVVDFRIGSGPYDKQAYIVVYAKNENGESVPVTNYDDYISCNLCQANSYATEGRFSVAETADQISVSSKDLFQGIKNPHFKVDKVLYAATLYKVDFSGCCDIWPAANYTHTYTLTKVKDSW